MASRFTYPIFKAFDGNSDLLIGGKLYCYDAGTTNPRDTYTTIDLTVAHTNPIILDSLGENEIFITGKNKFVLKDANDVTNLVKG